MVKKSGPPERDVDKFKLKHFESDERWALAKEFSQIFICLIFFEAKKRTRINDLKKKNTFTRRSKNKSDCSVTCKVYKVINGGDGRGGEIMFQ